jgi:hypothetical protein
VTDDRAGLADMFLASSPVVPEEVTAALFRNTFAGGPATDTAALLPDGLDLPAEPDLPEPEWWPGHTDAWSPWAEPPDHDDVGDDPFDVDPADGDE